MQKSRTDETNRIKLAPKLENQLYLGAEAVTIEEGAKQWISLAFTPDTTLLRGNFLIIKIFFLIKKIFKSKK